MTAASHEGDAMKNIQNFLTAEEGQTATEYMLLISVVVIAICAGGYTFIPLFRNGVLSLGQSVVFILTTGHIGDIGWKR
jgi:Flp pilus assembly pilin Flp